MDFLPLTFFLYLLYSIRVQVQLRPFSSGICLTSIVSTNLVLRLLKPLLYYILQHRPRRAHLITFFLNSTGDRRQFRSFALTPPTTTTTTTTLSYTHTHCLPRSFQNSRATASIPCGPLWSTSYGGPHPFAVRLLEEVSYHHTRRACSTQEARCSQAKVRCWCYCRCKACQ